MKQVIILLLVAVSLSSCAAKDAMVASSKNPEEMQVWCKKAGFEQDLEECVANPYYYHRLYRKVIAGGPKEYLPSDCRQLARERQKQQDVLNRMNSRRARGSFSPLSYDGYSGGTQGYDYRYEDQVEVVKSLHQQVKSCIATGKEKG